MTIQFEREKEIWNSLNLIDSLKNVLSYIEELPRYYEPKEKIIVYENCTRYVKRRLVKSQGVDWNESKDKEIHNLYLSAEILERCKNCKKKSEERLLIIEFRNEFIYDLGKVINKLDLVFSGKSLEEYFMDLY